MQQYIVTAGTLNKRRAVPAKLPDDKNIAGEVHKGFKFLGNEVPASEIPNPKLGKWYKDASGFYYSGGSVAIVKDSAPPLPIHLTAEQIKGATGATAIATAEKFLPYLIDTCAKYHINTPARQLCFLSQVGHESMGLYYTEELASGQTYEGRKDLGNTQPGDGVRFKGRGLIQITGRGNYKWLSSDFGIDFVTSPQLLGGKNAKVCTPGQLRYATQSAGWYWNNHDINIVADRINISHAIDAKPNYNHYVAITKKINGGTNGLNDRIMRYMGGLPFFR